MAVFYKRITSNNQINKNNNHKNALKAIITIIQREVKIPQLNQGNYYNRTYQSYRSMLAPNNCSHQFYSLLRKAASLKYLPISVRRLHSYQMNKKILWKYSVKYLISYPFILGYFILLLLEYQHNLHHLFLLTRYDRYCK